MNVPSCVLCIYIHTFFIPSNKRLKMQHGHINLNPQKSTVIMTSIALLELLSVSMVSARLEYECC